MAPENAVLELEREGWEALSTSADVAEKFYRQVLDGDVLVVLPGGLVIDDRERVVESMRQANPWDTYDLRDQRVVQVTDSFTLLTYFATAQRDGMAYQALITSGYVHRDDEWRLAYHQHTQA